MKTLSKALIFTSLLNACPLLADDAGISLLTYDYDCCGCLISRTPIEVENTCQQRELDARVFPLRTNGIINIATAIINTGEPTFYTITTLEGDMISRGNLHQNLTVTEIIGPAGIYLITVRQSETLRTFKVIKY
ncbi:MAG: T9SS type A sorting domain-containing protein [Muribaculaceae bacterium]|nr:T9SS type A sorting domain-containing protein [Muribaculaceae bacterium]